MDTELRNSIAKTISSFVASSPLEYILWDSLIGKPWSDILAWHLPYSVAATLGSAYTFMVDDDSSISGLLGGIPVGIGSGYLTYNFLVPKISEYLSDKGLAGTTLLDFINQITSNFIGTASASVVAIVGAFAGYYLFKKLFKF